MLGDRPSPRTPKPSDLSSSETGRNEADPLMLRLPTPCVKVRRCAMRPEFSEDGCSFRGDVQAPQGVS